MKPPKPKKHLMAMSYKPKIDRVFNGEIRQTMRMGRVIKRGDSILIFEWTGKSYRSKWGRRKRVTVKTAIPVRAWEDYVDTEHGDYKYPWDSEVMNTIAKLDGIDPPTGMELKRVLKEINGDNWEGTYYIIRW